MSIIFITGGARSGKSTFAQELAGKLGAATGIEDRCIVYLATSRVLDEEMKERIDMHRQSRPAGWTTVEEPLYLESALDTLPPDSTVVLLDCLTGWLSNLLLETLQTKEEKAGKNPCGNSTDPFALLSTEDVKRLEQQCGQKLNRFLEQIEKKSLTGLIVSNELGCGIVPEHYLGRLFRDLAGRMNQQVAAQAQEVYLVVSGVPVKIK